MTDHRNQPWNLLELLKIEAITSEHIEKHGHLNFAGQLWTTKEAVKLMGPDGGFFVNIGSLAGEVPAPQASAYSASNAAANAMTSSFSQAWSAETPRELGKSGDGGNGRIARFWAP